MCINFRSVSGSQASAFSYVSEFHTKQTVQRAASFTSSFISLVLVYLPLLAIIFIPMNWSFYISSTLEFTPWRLYMIVASGVNFVVFWIFCFVPESPRFLMQINEREKALDVLRLIYAFNTGNSKEVCARENDVRIEKLNQAAMNKIYSRSRWKKYWRNQLVEVLRVSKVSRILCDWCGRKRNLFSFHHSGTKHSDCRSLFSYSLPLDMAYLHGKCVTLDVGVKFDTNFNWFHRIPGFLLEMQNNIDSGKTLCQIVGHQTVSTESVQLHTDHVSFHFSLTISNLLAAVTSTIRTSAHIKSYWASECSSRFYKPSWAITWINLDRKQ